MKLQWEPTIHTTIMITLEPHPGRATPCKNLGTQTGRYCSWPRIFLRPFWPWLICKCDYPPVLPNYSNWWFEIGFCQKYPYLHLWWNTRSCVKRHHTLTLIGYFWCHFVADTFWTNEWLNYVSYRPIQVPIRLSDDWPVFKNLVFTGHVKMELFGSVCDIVDFQNAHFWSHIYLHIQVVNCPISEYLEQMVSAALALCVCNATL